MAPSWVSVTLSGTILNPDGSAAEGLIQVEPDREVTDPAAFFILPPVPIRIRLNAAGYFTVALPATDNSGWTPSGWKWKITEKVEGQPSRVFLVSLPQSTPVVDYTDII